MQQGRSIRGTATQFAIIGLVVALVVAVSVLMHVMFTRGVSDLTVEILAAVLAVVLVVASVGVTIHFQNRSETEREYRVELFKHKVIMYEQLLVDIAAADDDDTIDHHEIEQIRNMSIKVSLVSSTKLIKVLAEFVSRIEKDGQLVSDLGQQQGVKSNVQDIVNAMRADLDVVEPEMEMRPYIRSLFKKIDSHGNEEPGMVEKS